MRLLNGSVLILASSVLMAQQPMPEVRTWAQVQGGLATQHNAPCIKDEPAFGGGVGQWLGPRWGWEASLLEASLQDRAGLWTAREVHLDGSVLLAPFPSTGAWRPFLRAGLGGTRLPSPLSLGPGATTRLNLAGGVGAQYTFRQHGLFSLEARSTSVRSQDARTEFQFLLGFGLR